MKTKKIDRLYLSSERKGIFITETPRHRIMIVHFAFLLTDLNFNAVKSPQRRKQS